jgi:hypothetical protein
VKEMDQHYDDGDTGVIIFWVVIILSIIMGIITKFWLNTFILGFVILPILALTIKILLWRNEIDKENEKYLLRSMYCNNCHKKVIPMYVVGTWIWHCDKCGRSWKSKW